MTTQQQNEAIEFVPLLDFDNYEILNTYPFTIRHKDTHRVVSESNDAYGYIIVSLNRKQYKLHRLIALQFIHNDDPVNKYVVDHKNRNRHDNHLSNLHWTTPKSNSENRSSSNGVIYQYLDDIPDESVVVDSYNHHEFDEDRYYYWYDEDNDEDVFYIKIDDNIYRKLHINRLKSGARFVYMKSNNNTRIQIFINRFKQLFDL